MAWSTGSEEVPKLLLLLHELAEGLQSAENYLSALHRVERSVAHERTSKIDIVKRALDGLGRSEDAFHQLRAHLLVSASEAKVPGNREPITSTVNGDHP